MTIGLFEITSTYTGLTDIASFLSTLPALVRRFKVWCAGSNRSCSLAKLPDILAFNQTVLYHIEANLGTKKPTARNLQSAFYVDLPGFEPRQADPETAVLPLHHKSVVYFRTANVIQF